MEPLQKNERLTLSKIVSEQLKQFILDNHMLPGDKLPSEREMFKKFSVSRTVLREALRYLELSGFLVIRHGEGAFIKEQDLSPLMDQLVFQWKTIKREDRKELHDLRIMLELNAVDMIVSNGSADDLDLIEKSAKLCSQESNADKQAELDHQFHTTLIQSTHNRYFIQLAAPILQLCNALNIPVSPLPNPKNDLYILLVKSLLSKDNSLAKETIRKLLDL